MEAWPENSWRTKSLCRAYSQELFFPERENTASIPKAKAICRVCPVQEECLDTGLADPSLEGIWGGTTDAERRRLRAMLGGRKMIDMITD